MATISTEMSQQTTMNVYNDKGSGRVLAASASCSIRPERGLNISVDISDGEALAGVWEEAKEGLASYLEQQLKKAAELGIPVALLPIQSD